MSTRTAHPPRSRTAWSWLARAGRALVYLLIRLPIPGLGLIAVAVAAIAGTWAAALGIGATLMVGYVLLAVAAAPWQRRAVVLAGRGPVPDPHGRPGGGLPAAVRRRVREPATWREVAHALLALLLSPLDLVVLTAVGTGVVLMAAPLLPSGEPLTVGPLTLAGDSAAWLVTGGGLVAILIAGALTLGLAQLHASVVQLLLAPRGAELQRQVLDLTRSRWRLINAFDVERRRIERDLHDSAQQQLVALAMTLDLARMELEGTPHSRATDLLDRAHAQAVSTMTELRELIHGIHPPVLAELGLPGALRALADRSPIPVQITENLPNRLAAAVESAAYFVLAEALANSAKHSDAASIQVTVTLAERNLLVLEVTDNGTGGADPHRGTGLLGLGDRVSAIGGQVSISSPPGGPTTIQASLPRCVAEHLP